MEFILNLSLIINIILSFSYYLYNLDFLNYNNFFINKFDLYTLTLILFFYLIGLLRIFILFKKKQINKDIFIFFISDKKNYVLFFVLITLIFLINL